MIRAILILLLLVSVAQAETRRVAVVVGNNAGNEGQLPLRYAEIDAGKLGRVLVELGGVAADDLFLLKGKDLPALEAALARAKMRVAEHQKRGDRVVAIFYYSGHSDGVALEIGRERFTFGALRAWLKDTGAEVRLGLVDSCKSGALLAVKGGTPGPPFSIRLTDETSTTGEALLTSSAADENALESKEVGGSFFTHHLVSGLRGAADTSGDARVTLTEAYQYAYKHTISTSGATLAGPQHPTYDYRLSGHGDLVLTELANPTAGLSLPTGFDRALVIDSARDEVIAELGRDEPVHVALLPGRYTARVWKGHEIFEATFAIVAKQRRTIAWVELRPTTLVGARAKGADLAAAFSRRGSAPFSLSFGTGGRAAIAEQLDALAGIRIGVRSSRARGWSLAIDVNTRGDGALRESNLFGFVGYRLGVGVGRVRASAGLELGAGAIVQTLGDTSASTAVALAPLAELSIAVTARIAVALEAQVPATLLKEDGETSIVPLPAAWLGIVLAR